MVVVDVSILPATTILLVKSHVSSASSNIKDACVTPSPRYTEIPLVAAVAVSGLAWVVFNCNMLSSTSTVCVLSVVVVPFIVQFPVTVKSPPTVVFPVTARVLDKVVAPVTPRVPATAIFVSSFALVTASS